MHPRRTAQPVPAATNKPVVLRASGGNSILSELSNRCVAVAMEDALRLNVCAVAAQVYIGSEYEHQSINNIIKLVDAGNRYGMPVGGYRRRQRDDPRCALLLAGQPDCRRNGAQFVKTYFVEEGFEKVTASCPVPIVIAGGKNCRSMRRWRCAGGRSTRRVRGGYGAQHLPVQRPARDAEGGEKVVHENLNAREAYQFWQEEKQGELK